MERKDHAGMTRNEKAVNCLYPNPGAVFKLICFPWVGGGSTYYAKWGKNIHDSVEVHAIRLAGRESRLDEPVASDLNEIVDELVRALLPILWDKPFAFFGHSMGSYTAFLTAVQLKKEHKLEPIHLFLSSTFPPSEKSLYMTIPQQMSDEQICLMLANFGGTPRDIIDNKEFFQECLSKLKADKAILDKYCFDPSLQGILACDLTCFMGSEDFVKDMKDWKEVTSGKVDIHVLPGDHFYFMETSNENFIKNYITKCLEFSMLD